MTETSQARTEPAGAAVGATAAEPGPGRGPALGITGWLRWTWRQLTSMRTALVLLFLLAVASVPGSLLPQQGIDPGSLQQYFTAHPALAPWLSRLGLFNVFAAPWFAAIYLLLFVSLAGCVIPRTARLARSARALPPAAPRHLARLPQSARHHTELAPAAALDAATGVLRRRKFRLQTGDGWVSAEKGYRRELGNLLFHLSLLALLGAVALGGAFGYKANRLLVTGNAFANTVTDLDVFHPGRLVSANDLQPFSITLDRFVASYVTTAAERGQPKNFDAYLSYTAQPGGPVRRDDLRINHPLNVDGVKVYLIGHGYAPVFRVTDGTGKVVFDQPVPFIAANTGTFESTGVIKVPDARPHQLGFAGVFLPSAVDINGQLTSYFPAPLAPRVSLISYQGNLGMDSGAPQSVYELNTSGLRQLPVPPRPLAPGQSIRLPGGAGTLTFTGYRQWISLAVTYDPGQLPALIAGVCALAGLLLSFFIRRRRVFVRAYPAADGGSVVEVGGLARSDPAGGFDEEFTGLAAALAQAYQGSAPAAATDTPADHDPGERDS
jgi:cytochrome c biogenesis protein